MILGGRALDRAELEQKLRVLAQQEGASRQVVAAVGAPVTDPQALHLSYSLVCDMAELADLTQNDVILGIHADSRSMDAEQLVEEVRSFCYGTADAKDSHTIAAQLYWSVPYKEARDCLHHMVYAYLRVLTSEFPGAENLQEQLQERFTQRSWEVAGEEDVASQVGFASTSYFVRCFRESKGVSPAKYRIGKEE